MKKNLSLIVASVLLLALAACKTVREDVVPQTTIANKIVTPSRVVTTQAKLQALQSLVDSGMITDEATLKEAVKQLRKFDGSLLQRMIEKKKIVSTMEYHSPKNMSATNLVVQYNRETGAFELLVTNLVTFTDPEVVITAGDAQAKVTASEGEAFKNAASVGVDMLKEVNNLKKPVVPTKDE